VLEDKTATRRHLRDAFGFAQNDFVYLLTGSGFAMKGLDRAILAMAALPSELLQHTKLVAVGQDNPKQFQAMVNQLRLQNHVIISKGRADIPLLMQGADVCVHPAYRENTGLVILEGMACGAPILVTESCGYAHHVTEADAGLVNPLPFNQTAFNQQWLQMRTASESQRQAWASNGLSHTRHIMLANDGSAEANILIDLATRKVEKA
jgi:UDP-glucose:(heptosyl)LPS alpha-1,3-glucosyltransferase